MKELMSLPDNDIQAMVCFFETNGSFFKVGDANFESLYFEDVIEIINRLKATVAFMNKIESPEIDYERMISLTLYLHLSQKISIELSTLPRLYVSYKHFLSNEIDKASQLTEIDGQQEAFQKDTYTIRDSKYKFFPRTRWYLKGKVKENYALEPDSIMLHNGKIYVLDAKYYRYGITGNPMHLPESSSINKQITYGEYIYTQEKFKREYGDDVPVYNAFLMPYNSAKNVFGFDSIYGNIGEAKGDWKVGDHNYERVQGIVVDIRYLMYHYTGNHKSKILQLADTIEQALHDNGQMI